MARLCQIEMGIRIRAALIFFCISLDPLLTLGANEDPSARESLGMRMKSTVESIVPR